MKEKIFVSIDLETSGVDPYSDSIIEVGAIKYTTCKEIDSFSSLVKFDGQLSDYVQRLTGIKQSQLDEAPDWWSVRSELRDFLDGVDVVVGHNVAFDISFLRENNVDLSDVKIMDTYYMFGLFFPEEQTYSLEGLHRKYVGDFRAHRALDDARATIDLFDYCRERLKKITRPTIERVIDIARRGNWDYLDLFLEELAGRSTGSLLDKKRKPICKIGFDRQNTFSSSERKLLLKECLLSDYLSSWNDNSYQLLALSDRVFRFLKIKKKNYLFIDSQSKYICRNGIRKKISQPSLSTEDIGILAKILLKIENGFWDGYLEDLIIDTDEKKKIDDYRCNCSEDGELLCFFHYRLKEVFEKNRRAITRIGALESFYKKDISGLSVWLEDILFEDGLTYQTQKYLRQSELEKKIIRLRDCSRCGQKVSKDWLIDNNQKLQKNLEIIWSLLLLMTRSKGVADDYGVSLDLTPSIYQGHDVGQLFNKIQEFENDVNDYLAEIGQCLSCQHVLKEILEVLWGVAGKNCRVARLIEDKSSGDLIVFSYFRDFRQYVNHFLNEFTHVAFMARSLFFNEKYYASDLFFEDKNMVFGEPSSSKINVELIRNYGFSREEIAKQIDWQKKSIWLFSSKYKAISGLEQICQFFDDTKQDMVIGTSDIRKGNKFTKGLLVASVNEMSYLSLKISDIDSIFLESLPFDPPGSLLIGHRSVIYGENSFDRYYASRMLSKLKYVVTLLKLGGKFYLADARLENRTYGRDFFRLFFK